MEKIPIFCPKCKEEIVNLTYNKTKEIWGSCSLDEGGDLEFLEEFDIEEEQKEYTYMCPVCNEILFEDYEEAVEFLEDKDKLREIVKEKMEKIENASL